MLLKVTLPAFWGRLKRERLRQITGKGKLCIRTLFLCFYDLSQEDGQGQADVWAQNYSHCICSCCSWNSGRPDVRKLRSANEGMIHYSDSSDVIIPVICEPSKRGGAVVGKWVGRTLFWLHVEVVGPVSWGERRRQANEWREHCFYSLNVTVVMVCLQDGGVGKQINRCNVTLVAFVVVFSFWVLQRRGCSRQMSGWNGYFGCLLM